MPVLYGTRVYPDGVHDFKYEGDGTMVINLAWSHAVDDMGLWDNYGNLNRDLQWILREGGGVFPSTLECRPIYFDPGP